MGNRAASLILNLPFLVSSKTSAFFLVFEILATMIDENELFVAKLALTMENA